MKRSNRKRLTASVAVLAILLSLCGVTVTSQKKAKAAVELSNPTTDSEGVSTWDCIYFGNYPQSEYTPETAPKNPVSGQEYTDSDGTKMVYWEWREWEGLVYASNHGYFKVEPIKWRVLSVNGDDAFLLADQILDAEPYNEECESVTWETCTLRTWLNTTFLSAAFTSDEQNAIKSTKVVNEDNTKWDIEGGNDTTDKVYLLSIAEASNTAYGFNGDFRTESETRQGKTTEYAKVRGARTIKGIGYWWLRSPGCVGDNAANVLYYGDGDQYGSSVDGSTEWLEGSYGDRPALHINLSFSTHWSYAGKVSANGGGGSTRETPSPAPSVTPTPAPGNSGSVTPSPSSTPDKVTAPAKVTLKSVENKKGKKVLAKWKKVSGADGYRIQYAAKKSFKGKKSVTVSKTSYTIKKLKKKSTCYVRVCAYKNSAEGKVYGKWSAVKNVKIKK